VALNASLFVSPHQMVEHRIGIHLQAGGVAGGHRRQVLGTGAVLGGHTALLVELTQVVGVVDAIAHIQSASLPLARRRQPQGGDPRLGEVGSLPGQPPPMPTIGGRVPVERLQQHTVAVCLRPRSE
jgi:hypothetical protein